MVYWCGGSQRPIGHLGGPKSWKGDDPRTTAGYVSDLSRMENGTVQ